MTYEGARSITGPYLAILGANAATVGFVAGFGEFAGYALRIVSGYLSDRTKQYWFFTILGYFCNLLAVPLLALTDKWWLAAFLIILERTGKAIRVPPRDAMLSHAGQKIGMGWVFGLHEAIDQIGSLLGPLMVALVLYFHGGYKMGFAILLLPAIISLSFLIFARFQYPEPQQLEIQQDRFVTKEMNAAFWFYLAGASLVAAGYADFSLIAYHFQKKSILSPIAIPISYAIATGLNSISAPILGHYYDKKGFIILILVTLIGCLFAPLTFLGNASLAYIGIALWSIGVSAHESLMQAIVAKMVPMHKRSSAYGVFNAGYGISWFIGSFIMGFCYDISVFLIVLFSLLTQFTALPFLWLAMKKIKNQ